MDANNNINLKKKNTENMLILFLLFRQYMFVEDWCKGRTE